MLTGPSWNGSVPAVNLRYSPQFVQRTFSKQDFVPANDPASSTDPKMRLAVRLRLNDAGQNRIPTNWGGGIRAAQNISGHSFQYLIPPYGSANFPTNYFTAQSNWFGSINGMPRDYAQLDCLKATNTAYKVGGRTLAQELAKNSMTLFDADAARDPTYIVIGQNDGVGAWANDAATSNAVAAEGSLAGPLLSMVNAAAQELNALRASAGKPPVQVGTFAYYETLTPPQNTKPRDDVFVRFCPVERDALHALNNGRWNQSLFQKLQGWCNINSKAGTWIFDYSPTLITSFTPQPNIKTLGADIAAYANNGVQGYYCMLQGNSTVGDLGELRAWLMARLLWNPALSTDALIDEFLIGYYGAAAANIRSYINRLEAAATNTVFDYVLSPTKCGPDGSLRWLNSSVWTNAANDFASARAAVISAPTLLARVDRSRLSVLSQWIRGAHAFQTTAARQGQPNPAPTPAALASMVTDFKNIALTNGITDGSSYFGA